VRRPQRPGNQFCAETLSGGTLPATHPRELPGTAGSAAMLRQGTQNISLDVSTLLLAGARFKQKSRGLCAETVNASVSLWKALEKWNEFHLSTLRIVPFHPNHSQRINFSYFIRLNFPRDFDAANFC